MHNVRDGKQEVYTLNANVTNTNIQTDRGFVLLTCTAGKRQEFNVQLQFKMLQSHLFYANFTYEFTSKQWFYCFPFVNSENIHAQYELSCYCSNEFSTRLLHMHPKIVKGDPIY